jgi:hypothetical protein
MNQPEPNRRVADRRVSAWTEADLASQFEDLARRHDRSIAAELRRAMKLHLERERADVYANAERELTRLENVGGQV